PPLRVGFTHNAKGLRENTPYKQMFLDRVIRPILPLFGAIEDYSAGSIGRASHYVGLRDISRFHVETRAEVPRIKVPMVADATVRLRLGGRKPITLTLRECNDAYPHRNSNLEDWMLFAMWLKDRGEDVIIVRDTGKADEQLPELDTYPEASKDLHIRAAL